MMGENIEKRKTLEIFGWERITNYCSDFDKAVILPVEDGFFVKRFNQDGNVDSVYFFNKEGALVRFELGEGTELHIDMMNRQIGREKDIKTMEKGEIVS